jgi:hypothetical protein
MLNSHLIDRGTLEIIQECMSTTEYISSFIYILMESTYEQTRLPIFVLYRG